MRVDIQATFADAQVLVVRPIAFDITAFARQIVQQFGLVNLPLKDLVEAMKALGESSEADPERTKALMGWLNPFGTTFENVTLPVLKQILAGIQQLALLDWHPIGESFKQAPDAPVIPLMNILARDSTGADLQHGICPVPPTTLPKVIGSCSRRVGELMR